MLKKNTHILIIFESTVSIVLFSFVPIIIKSVSANVYTIGIIRLLIATTISFMLIQKRGYLSLFLKYWGVLALTGLLFGLHWILFFTSIKISSPSLASIGLSSYGVQLIVLGWLFCKNKLFITDLIAVIIATLGNIIIVAGFSFNDNRSIGLILGILSGFFFACIPIVNQRYHQIPSLLRSFGQFLFALLFFSCFFNKTRWDIHTADWFGLMILSIGCTFIAHTLWIRVVTKLSTATTSLIHYLDLPITMFLSFIIINELIDEAKIYGATLVIIANICGLYSQWKKDSLIAKLK